jgi:hypothetical protein
MIRKDIPPTMKLNTPFLLLLRTLSCGWRIRWPFKPHPLVRHVATSSNSWWCILPFHFVQHHVVQYATCNKNILTYLNTTMFKSAIQNSPPCFQYSKYALDILSYAFHVCRKCRLTRRICLRPHKLTDSYGPLQVTIIANEINTCLFLQISKASK